MGNRASNASVRGEEFTRPVKKDQVALIHRPARAERQCPPPELELDSPAIYVDSVPAIANPCYPNGSLDMTPSNGGPGCNVFVFHHLYIDNNWKAILEDQVSKLIFSGLYDRAEAVFQLYRGATPRTWRRQCSFCIASAANSAF